MEQDISKYKIALKKAADKIENLSNQINSGKSNEDIAIIGCGCRFPGGANDPDAFWEILKNGIDTVTEIPDSRFPSDMYCSSNRDEAGKMYTRNGAFLNIPIDKFDNRHFEISPVEASSIDPQQRLLLEVSWEALENAGLNIEKLKGSSTGVFIGINSADYIKAQIHSGNAEDINSYSVTGVSFNAACGRLSYFYDFKGPSIAFDTACSSSLVALNAAVQSLRKAECDMAIVGGVNMILTPESFIGLSKINGLSEDGRCKAFDASADGFGRGEGCGIVILKRLADAGKDKNSIHAVVKSVSVGQDGRTNGFTAPNGISQRNVIKQALEQAGLSPEDIDYVEAHGAGTELGDLIEVQALSEVFKNRNRDLLIGAVKTNIAHLEAAAGIAGLIKVILALKNGKIPPSIHFNNPNPNIQWKNIHVADKAMDWKNGGQKRRAGISSFGFSGTLAHAIIEEAPEEVPGDRQELPWHAMTLSAKDDNTLRETVIRMKEYLSGTKSSINDICYTANMSRGGLNYRFGLSAQHKEGFIRELESCLENEQQFKEFASDYKSFLSDNVVFLFTGQGSIYKDIGRSFYETSETFKNAIDLCEEKFKSLLDISVTEALYGSESGLLQQAIYSQPIIFSIEYALAALWNTLGIKPKAVIGHSIGEYSAACYAGLLSLDDAAEMIAYRGKMMDSVQAEGKMVGVLTNEAVVRSAISETGCRNVSVAAVNGPENTTVSGLHSEVDIVIDKIQQQQRVFCDKLPISHPFHSILMKPYEHDYFEKIKSVSYGKPHVDIISTVTGKLEDDRSMGKIGYWVSHLSNPVRFYDAVQTAKKLGYTIFIEIGGTATLCGLANQCLPEGDYLFAPSLRQGANEYKQFLDSAVALYLRGVELDWDTFYSSYKKAGVILPNYPFQRKSFWIDLNNRIPSTTGSGKTSQEQSGSDTAAATLLPVLSVKTVKAEKNRERITADLKEIIHTITGLELEEINEDTNLFSLGFDSLLLINFKKRIDNKYGLDISLNEFLMELNSVSRIAGHIYANMPDSIAMDHIDSSFGQQFIDSDFLNFMDHQLGNIQQQLEMVKSISKQKYFQDNPAGSSPDRKVFPKLNYGSMIFEQDKLNPAQIKFLEYFKEKYILKTKTSREYASAHRGVLSDWINSLNFRLSMKDILYPVVSKTSQGARFWDIDGNEYIDLAIGYGVHYFGHNPPFIRDAIANQLSRGFELGPQCELAGKVAQLVHELTGVERVAICNTGSEAVMEALRISRAARKRDRIVRFAGSYHGTFDGVLTDSDEEGPFPASQGTTYGMVKDTVSLIYGSQESIEYIEEHHQEIAAVLVEPVQSRKPGFHPKAFLHQLRELTARTGIILIFDEMVNGFRIHPGGAQAYFGIKADIVTYGKIVGGGMPIGMIAGKKEYIDMIDGGAWNFGDLSMPEKSTVVFAGTFCKHPLTMAASYAALSYLKEKGEALQNEVNRKTELFAGRINEFFETEKVPVRVRYFGSQFRFESFGKYDLSLLPIEMDIFFYLLLYKGIYTWERRTCCFCTEITEEDIDIVVQKIKESIYELRQGGFSFSEDDSFAADEDTTGIAPMSLAQKRLYTLINISDTDTYNIIGTMKIKGKLDIKRLEEIFKSLIVRHESLRTRLFIRDNELLQEVLPEVDFKVDVIHREASQDLDELIGKTVRRFELSNAPLVRVSVIETAEAESLLLIDMHHTIADGLSVNILTQEFIRLYEGRELEPAVRQYREYAAFEEEFLNSDNIKKNEAYWLKKLSGDIVQLNLPADYKRPAALGSEGNTVKMKISSVTVSNLRELGRKTGTSLFMVLVSAFNILLHKLTGNEDILIGTPVTNRKNGEFDNSVGMYTNTIVLRNFPDSRQKYSEFLKEVRQSCLEAYANMDYPFNLLVNKLNIKRDLNTNPLFNVIFIYENANDRVFRIKDLDVENYDYKLKTAKFDFSVEILEENGLFNVNLNYRTDLFMEETIERWGEYFANILNSIINDENISISDMELVTQSEKNQLIYGFNKTDAPYPREKTINELFEEQAERNPGLKAVVSGKQSLTYKELNYRANQIAHILREKNVKPDTVVGIMAERSVEMILGIMGILKAGGAYLPIDPNLPKNRIDYMAEDSNMHLLLTTSKARKDLNKITDYIFLDDERLYSGGLENNPGNVNNPEDLAYVIYTSGTTGTPKGVMIEHKSVVNLVCALSDGIYSNYNNGLNIALVAPYTFDASVKQIFAALLLGNSLYIVPEDDRREGDRLVKFYLDNGIEITDGTPIHLAMIADSELIGNKNLRLKNFIIGGDELPENTLERLFARMPGTPVVTNVYGPTECCVDSTCININSENLKQFSNIPIGKPLNNYRAYILKGGELCPTGVPGELCIAGEGVSRGYLNKPELTKDKFTPNPFVPGETIYRTGDLARRMPDGNIEFLGRIDHQVKIRGYRIEPGDIEAQLLKNQYVKEAAVAVKEDHTGNRYLCAYIVSDRKVATEEIREFLAGELPDYFMPSHFVQLDRLPLSQNGKLDRNALPDPEMSVDNQEYEAPRNEIEEKLVEAWTEVLGIKNIGIRDNFFVIGGDSIKALQIMILLSRTGLRMEVKDLFANPCIKSLGKYVTRETKAAEADEPVEGLVELTPIQKRFFNNNPEEVNHFNHAIMLYREDGFDKEIVERAFMRLIRHHDALRMVYERKDGRISQRYRGPEEKLFDLYVHDVRGMGSQQEEVELIASNMQKEISISEGALVKLCIFKTEKGEHLLIAIHHLVIDGVSWRILLEDFGTLYEKALKGQEAELPHKTDSYKVFAEKINEYAHNGKLSAEKDFWVINSLYEKNLFIDAKENRREKFESVKTLSISLEKETTRQLIREANRAYNTEINDILITALLLALRELKGENRFEIFMEGHGRDILENVDTSRTVGWFTAIYPVNVELRQQKELSLNIKTVKETIRRIPNKGIGYGILKYLLEDRELPQNEKPPVLFNYMGQLDNIHSDLFSLSWLPSGQSSGNKIAWIPSLEIAAAVVNGCLTVSTSYSENEYGDDVIKELNQRYKVNLEWVIHHCVHKEDSEKTPSDYGDKEISLEQLAEIGNKYAGFEIEKIYPLSNMQKGMLFHALEDPDSRAYFEQTVMDISGNIDANALEFSFNAVMKQHEALRAAFEYEITGEPRQIVIKDRKAGFAYIDISEKAAGEKIKYVDNFIKEDAEEGFDLNKQALMRAALIRISGQGYKLIWSHHHIIADGWCLGLIISDLFEVYGKTMRHEAYELQDTRPYSDYIRWLEAQDREAGEKYFAEYLAGYEEKVYIPRLSHAGAAQPYQREEKVFELSRELTGKLTQLAGNNNVTVNTVLQCIWGIILGRYNNTDDVVFGTIVSGRNPEFTGIEKMVGIFINTLPTRIKLKPSMSVGDLLKTVQSEALENDRHSYMNLSEIQTLSKLNKELINHIFVYENYSMDSGMLEDNEAQGFKIDAIKALEQTNYSFNIVAYPGEKLKFQLIYDGGIYDKRIADNIELHLRTVAEQIAEDDSREIHKLCLLSQQERNMLLYKFNDTKTDYPRDKTIHELFEEQAEKTPDNTAVVYKDMRVTYGELNGKADLLAAVLREKGVKPGNMVGIMERRSIDMIVGIMGILKAGGAYLPIDPNFPRERVSALLKDAAAPVLLTSKEHVPEAGNFVCPSGGIIYLEELEDCPDIDITVKTEYKGSAGDLAYVMYTSGSTGRPKGILISHRNVVRLVKNTNYIRFEKGDRILMTGAVAFDASTFEIWGSLLNGLQLHLTDEETILDAERLGEELARNNITTLWLTSPLFNQLAQQKPEIFMPLKYLLVGGDVLSPKYINMVREICKHLVVINGYGPTENTTFSVCFPIDRDYGDNIPIGRPISNSTAYIADTYGNPQPVGVYGELWVGGDGVANGYLNRPELSEEKFIPDPFAHKSSGNRLLYRTGDLARWLPDGKIEFLGRMDQQVKIRGFRIELGEIESRLLKYKGVKEAVVIARQDKNDSKYLCGYISSDEPVKATELREFLGRELPGYMLPAYFVFLDKLPLTGNGKVDAGALPGPDVNGNTGKEYTAPENAVEEKLTRIWSQVLESGRVGIRDNFFEIGGNSLKVMQIIKLINKEFNVNLGIKVFFENPDIKSLAGLISLTQNSCDSAGDVVEEEI